MLDLQIQGLAELNTLLNDLAKTSPKRTVTALNRIAYLVQKKAKLKATNINRKAGLAKTIHVDPALVNFRNEAQVYCTHSAGKYQEFGTATKGEFPTGAYLILPKVKKALSNHKKGGKSPFPYGYFGPVKAVIHPGIKARPFMRPAAQEGIKKSVEILREAFQ